VLFLGMTNYTADYNGATTNHIDGKKAWKTKGRRRRGRIKRMDRDDDDGEVKQDGKRTENGQQRRLQKQTGDVSFLYLLRRHLCCYGPLWSVVVRACYLKNWKCEMLKKSIASRSVGDR